MSWQPISEYKHNGERVLIIYRDGYIDIGSAKHGKSHNGMPVDGYDFNSRNYQYPAHFMPLPSEPDV